MQSSQNHTEIGPRFDILLFDAFSNHCLANTVEPLRAANSLLGKTHYAWRFLTRDGAPVESSSGLQVAPHCTLQDGEGATLITMPSYGFRELAGRDVIQSLRSSAHRYGAMAGFDTGSWLLAAAGLLDGYRATIHWEELTNFAEAFPNVETCRERYVIDRTRVTCSGAMAAFDLIMHLIGETHGQLLALEVGQLFMAEGTDRTQARPTNPRSKPVSRAIEIMQDSIENPMPIGDVAALVGLTQRALEVRMKDELQTTPQSVYRRMRLAQARRLVQDSEHSVAEIASRSGYENASAMTRAFKSEFGQTPRDMRS